MLRLIWRPFTAPKFGGPIFGRIDRIVAKTGLAFDTITYQSTVVQYYL